MRLINTRRGKVEAHMERGVKLSLLVFPRPNPSPRYILIGYATYNMLFRVVK